MGEAWGWREKVWWRKIIRSSLGMPNFPIGKLEDTREKAGKGGQWPALEDGGKKSRQSGTY